MMTTTDVLVEELVDLIAPWHKPGEQENGDYFDPDNMEMINKIRGHIRDIERENMYKVLEYLVDTGWMDSLDD